MIFDAEPGAYGVASNLAADGSENGVALFADVTTAQGTSRARLTASWKGTYYEAQ